uniref:Uncharacterized protein n=1 Tax=Anopheles coluzzii TaxID=1518534 RepID=A0A8W7PBK7_ANOCL
LGKNPSRKFSASARVVSCSNFTSVHFVHFVSLCVCVCVCLLFFFRFRPIERAGVLVAGSGAGGGGCTTNSGRRACWVGRHWAHPRPSRFSPQNPVLSGGSFSTWRSSTQSSLYV